MNLLFAPKAWDDYLYWQATDPKTVTRLHELIKDICRDPYRGIGKPEPLRHQLQGFWSRRINAKDRIVYRLVGDTVHLVQMRHHY